MKHRLFTRFSPRRGRVFSRRAFAQFRRSCQPFPPDTKTCARRNALSTDSNTDLGTTSTSRRKDVCAGWFRGDLLCERNCWRKNSQDHRDQPTSARKVSRKNWASRFYGHHAEPQRRKIQNAASHRREFAGQRHFSRNPNVFATQSVSKGFYAIRSLASAF